jgi:MSHA biogenesis protein MshP
MNRSRSSGIAMFAVIFLIVALAAIGIAVATITGTQQLASAQGLDAARAYYVAHARMERAIAETIATEACPDTSTLAMHGFTTELSCPAPVPVSEGGSSYTVVQLTATAYRGSRESGTRVRRQLRVQLTAGL